jgi:phosphoribosylformimino-5-aminoimidazole carboxamide ribotide isomerase
MNIIPVLDLKDGQVVHAKYGDRQNYQAIQSALTDSSEPTHIVQALLALYPFKQLYIADIDAIQKTGHHQPMIEEISLKFPQLELWVDSGFSNPKALSNWAKNNIRAVLGSESIASVDHYQSMISACQQAPIMSLDFKNNAFLGAKELINRTELWPNDVIVMTLDKVGSNTGPDIEQLSRIKDKCLNSSVFAAGGVRSASDLEALKTAGISGVLVASALHQGSLDKTTITKLQA